MRKYLDTYNIPSTIFDSKDDFDFNSDSVKLVTMHSIKGLEFKVVMIIGLNNRIMPLNSVANEFDDEDIEEDVRRVPVFNEIAAGKPIFINDQCEGEFYLPDLWTKSMKDIFILKIKGDSMINKKISNEDYVLINKQSTANIGDIVAVDIDGNATLKTYKRMGGKILLIPENDAYELMFLDEEQVNVIGVAVGVIKKSNE